MSQAEISTGEAGQGRLSLDEASCFGGLSYVSASAQADEVASSGGRPERQGLSPQAAAVLPVMLALARLQARRTLEEQVG